MANYIDFLMFDLMEPKNFFIPNAKMQDMFQPDSISMDFIYQDTVGNFVRIWIAGLDWKLEK